MRPSPSVLPPALDEDHDDFSADDDDSEGLPNHDSPLKYFLTPAPPTDDDFEFDFELDAGIEDPRSPRQIVRSISPSTLDGLRKYKPKGSDADCAVSDDDEEDDEEDYIRFTSKKSLPFGFDDYFDHPRHSSSPTSPLSRNNSTDALLSPNSFHVGSPRGRLAKRFIPQPRRSSRGRPRSLSLQRRHSWREPSPDVWSIEEEPEKETMSEMGFSTDGLEDGTEKKTLPIDIPAAKPTKKVRFILPDHA